MTSHSTISSWSKAFATLALGLFAFAAILPFLVPAPAAAQMPVVTCFVRQECLKPNTQGACDDQHCFELRPDACPNGQGACYVNPPSVPLIISIGGKDRVLDIGDYVATVFNYGLNIATLIASVMFMIGGFQVLTGGDSDRVKKGKERLKNALIGLLLLLGARAMLWTINPNILKLEMPRIPVTKRTVFTSCAFTESCAPCGVPYVVLAEKGTGKTAASVGDCSYARIGNSLSSDDAARYDLGAQCIGKGCGPRDVPAAAGEPTCSESVYRCSIARAGEKFQCGHPPAAAPAGSASGTSGGYACKSCKGDGVSCGATGANDECCGGFCADTVFGNICTAGEPGDACDDDRECRTGKCQRSWGDSCSAGELGSPCTATSQCKDGLRCSLLRNVCTSGKMYSACLTDADCGAGFHCPLRGDMCVPTSMTANEFLRQSCSPDAGTFTCCASNADCTGRGGWCNTAGSGRCTDGSEGAPCNGDRECASSICANNVCTRGINGSACDDDTDCVSRHCYEGGDFNVCVSGARGSRCDDQTDCAETLKCDQKRCVQQ